VHGQLASRPSDSIQEATTMHVVRRALALSALAALVTVAVPTAGAQTSTVTEVIGAADGLSSALDVQVGMSSGGLNLPATPSVTLPPEGGSVSDEAGPIVLITGAVVTVALRATTAAVSAEGELGPAGFASAETTVEELTLDIASELVGLSLVSADAVSATCSADLDGVSASTTLVGATIFGEAIETDPEPNTEIAIGGEGATITGTLNQQIENADGSLSVSALVLDVDVEITISDVNVDIEGTLAIGPATCGVVEGLLPDVVPEPLLTEPRFTG
jgi:hypothetical protein